MDLRISLRRMAAVCVFTFCAMAAAAESAAAQDACPALVGPPELVDGATATQAQMASTHQAYTAWADARIAALNCYRAQAEPLTAENQTLRAAHDAAADYLNSVSALWRAQVDAFNVRTAGPNSATPTVQMPTPPSVIQVADCPTLQPAEQMPSSGGATRAQIDAYNTRYTSWGTAFRSGLECYANAVRAQEARTQPLVATYNRGNTELGERNTAWQAEINEFTARSPQRAGRSPEGDEMGD